MNWINAKDKRPKTGQKIIVAYKNSSGEKIITMAIILRLSVCVL